MMAKLLRHEEYEIDDKIIERDRLFSVYVFGVPRSGTSMMTRIVELLGVNMVYTSETEKHIENRNKMYEHKFGESHPNPTGIYEIVDDFTYFSLQAVSKPYSGCKMIMPVNGFCWDLVKRYPCKVIMMTRNVEEISQSQMSHYGSRRSDMPAEVIKRQLDTQKAKLEKFKIKHMIVDYHDVLEHPLRVINDIAGFIRATNTVSKAVESVQPKQNRFKMGVNNQVLIYNSTSGNWINQT